MRVLSLFDGMSCGQIALNRAGIVVDTYYSSEICRDAMSVTKRNYPNTVFLGDIERWREWEISWEKIDLILGGSPCQGFSVAGNGEAFRDSRSKLFFTYTDILNHVKNKNPKVLFMLENVPMIAIHRDKITTELGVPFRAYNSKKVSAQLRNRLYWFNWEAEKLEGDGDVLEDILDEGTPKLPNESVNREGKAYCLTYSYPGAVAWNSIERRQRTMVPVEYTEEEHPNVVNGVRYRLLTPTECERLQTVPENYTEGVSNTKRYQMLGNGWTVEVIAHIFRGI